MSQFHRISGCNMLKHFLMKVAAQRWHHQPDRGCFNVQLGGSIAGSMRSREAEMSKKVRQKTSEINNFLVPICSNILVSNIWEQTIAIGSFQKRVDIGEVGLFGQLKRVETWGQAPARHIAILRPGTLWLDSLLVLWEVSMSCRCRDLVSESCGLQQNSQSWGCLGYFW